MFIVTFCVRQIVIKDSKKYKKYAMKTRNDTQSRVRLRWGGVAGNTMTGRHHGVPAGSHAIPLNIINILSGSMTWQVTIAETLDYSCGCVN